MAAPKAGDRLNVKKGTELMYEAKEALKRLGIERGGAPVFATFVDGTGVSISAKRDPRRGEVQAFIANGQFDNWMSYFEVSGEPPNAGMRKTVHFTRKFPRECV